MHAGFASASPETPVRAAASRVSLLGLLLLSRP
jgi:hypothetical protein